MTDDEITLREAAEYTKDRRPPRVTVNHHAFSVLTPDGWEEVCNHRGACTVENCGQYMAAVLKREREVGNAGATLDAMLAASRRGKTVGRKA